MKVQVFLHLLLVCVAIAAPASKSSKKYPKKFNKDVHTITVKKTKPVDSSYASYKYAEGNTIPLLPPPPPPGSNYEDKWWSLVNSGMPIFVYREDIQPRLPSRLLPPSEDTYSMDPTGEFTEEMRPPPILPDVEEEPESYTFYVDEGSIPLKVPEPSSYVEVPLFDETAPNPFSVDLQPPPEEDEEPLFSSYSSIVDKEAKEFS